MSNANPVLEHLARIKVAALMVALDAPKKRSKYAHHATVQWRLIEELRVALGDFYTNVQARIEAKDSDPGPSS